MIFSEIYGLYYEVIQKIIQKALKKPVTEREIRDIIYRHAFPESAIYLEEAIHKGRWQILRPDGRTVIQNNPRTPLSILQKGWMKAISLDPKMALFAEDFSALKDIEPLFRPEDIYYFDQYSDGDNFSDKNYIRRFHMILEAIGQKRPIKLRIESKSGQDYQTVLLPKALEYSEKDNKFRLIGRSRTQKTTVNLGRILACQFYEQDFPVKPQKASDPKGVLEFLLWDEREALERAFLHFAHFEKEAQKLDEKEYLLKLFYEKEDETELLIRILSFGPLIKVLAPDTMVAEIRKRLRLQKKLIR